MEKLGSRQHQDLSGGEVKATTDLRDRGLDPSPTRGFGLGKEFQLSLAVGRCIADQQDVTFRCDRVDPLLLSSNASANPSALGRTEVDRCLGAFAQQ